MAPRAPRAGWRARAADTALFAAAACAGWALLTLVTGGFTLAVRLFTVAAHDPLRPALAALACLAIGAAVDGRRLRARAREIRDRPASTCGVMAAVIAMATFAAAVAWNTSAAGGSDSSCYVLQSDAFERGDAVLREPLALAFPGPAATALFAPTGWIASPVERGAAVPICGPGLGLMMAGASVVAGPRAVYGVVPVAAALLVWATFLLGRRMDQDVTGVLAALLVACSPIALYQAVQPMSDTPAAALWLAALVACARGDRRGDVIGGACVSLAVLVRPNLALLVLPLVALVYTGRRDVRARSAALARVGAAALPAIVALAWLNARRYGSPVASGYGDTGVLFSAAHVWPNLQHYTRWLIESQTPFVLLALGVPWWARGRRGATPALVWAAAAASVLLSATYFAYVVFEQWWFLRFLLPIVPVIIVFAVAVLRHGLSRVTVRPVLASAVACAVLGGWYLQWGRSRQIFDLQSLEARFVLTGTYAGRAVPRDAVVFSIQESGAIQHYGGQTIAMWDQVQETQLDEAVAWFVSRHRPVYFALEDWEEPRFRSRFATGRFGRLDWPPSAEIHAAVRVRVYAAEDRARYVAGEPVRTAFVR